MSKAANGNPIADRKTWEKQREECLKDPGKFHGNIAKQEIYWYETKSKAWIKKTGSTWTAFDSSTGQEKKLKLAAGHEPWTRAFNDSDAPFYKWFDGGFTNACFNEVDAHVLAGFGAETAIIFEGEQWDPSLFNGKGGPVVSRTISRQELQLEVALRSIALRDLGLKKGDCIAIHMPNLPEQIFYIEAAKRLGVIYSCIASGLSVKAIGDRIEDLKPKAVITCNLAYNLGEAVPFKEKNIDAVLAERPKLAKFIKSVVVVENIRAQDGAWNEARDHREEELLKQARQELKGKDIFAAIPPLPVPADFPLFVMYTSGSTGKPKGVVHTHGGYIAGLAHTMRVSFNVTPGDGKRMFVVADPGWITGQSYMISAALTTRTTSVISEGSPILPEVSRFASVIERNKVNIFKAGSTFLKAVQANPKNVEEVKRYDLSSLEVATFCAEPTSPSVQKFGMEIMTPQYINSYWGTEHGGIVLTHFFGNKDFPLRPDAHTYPLPWVETDVWVTGQEGDFKTFRPAKAGEKGEIVLKAPYPYLLRTIWGDAENVNSKAWKGDLESFKKTYYPDWKKNGKKVWTYTQGDFACKYADGSFSLHGRSDDVINTSGVRIGTEEVEGVILNDKRLTADSPIGNALVVGAPHAERGTAPIAFVQLVPGRAFTPADEKRLNTAIAKERGENSIPVGYIILREFPETRSGKYMRRILRHILEGEPLGDVSTLKNPAVLEEITGAVTSWMASANAQTGANAFAEIQEGCLVRVSTGYGAAEAKSAVTDVLKTWVADVLSSGGQKAVQPAEINAAEPFREMGVGSLKLITLNNMIVKGLGAKHAKKMSVTQLFSYPTIERFAEHLVHGILGMGAPEESPRPNARRTSARSAHPHEPIAIVGAACRFPGGVKSPEDFWKLLSDGACVVSDLPRDRWNVDQFYDPNPETPGKMYVKRAGTIGKIDEFDAGFFDISPTEAMALDPQHRLLLEVTWEALERSGRAPDSLVDTRTAVFVGITSREYAELLENSEERDSLDAYIPTGNNLNVASGRISYFLGLRGPSISVDTACSSSLVALHLSCENLRSGETDMAIAGGVNLMLSPDFSISLSKAKALSPQGLCKTFDANADGYVRSEGCAMFVLKRMSDAVRDGDNILGLIAGSAVNNDGISSGLTAPNGKAQEELIRDALRIADVKPAQVSYIEAHGTGTPLGDPIEFQAFSNVYREGRASDKPLMIGSVKTNIGHAESAAGAAGLMKVLLSLQNDAIPAHLHFKKPNPHIQLESIPGRIPVETSKWTAVPGNRIAGLSSFGFSGTNAHLVIQEAPKSAATMTKKKKAGERPMHVLCMSAKNAGALKAMAQSYGEYLANNPGTALADFCYTANFCRAQFDERLTVSAATVEEMKLKLQAFAGGKNGAGVVRATVRKNAGKAATAFLYTGQGAQYAGMAKELYETEPVFQKAVDECADLLKSYMDKPLLEVWFGKYSDLIDQTRYTQPSMFVLEYALTEMWRSWGVVPEAVMGHSVGEYCAAVTAGVMGLEDGLKLISTRARLMQEIKTEGGMLACMASEEKVREAIAPFADKVSIAGYNGPALIVIAGFKTELNKAAESLQKAGVKTKPLTVSHAFHSPQMDGILEKFAKVLKTVKFSAPKIKMISNLTGTRLTAADIQDPNYWCRHLREPVRFSQGTKELFNDGNRIFLEIGPGTTLAGMAKGCVPDDAPVTWATSLKKDRKDWEQIFEAVGTLYGAGVNPDWQGFDAERPMRSRIMLPTYPFQRKRYWPKSARRAAAGASTGSDLHPFLGIRVASPSGGGQVLYQSVLDVKGYNAFIKQHIVHEEIVVPAATYMDMAISAAINEFGTGVAIVESMNIEKPVVAYEGRRKFVQTVLTPQTPGVFAFQIFTAEAPAGNGPVPEWISHVQGKISVSKQKVESILPEKKEPIADIQARCKTEVTMDQFYTILKRVGIDPHGVFRTIKDIHGGKAELISRVQITDAMQAESESFQFHPSYLDSFIQLPQGMRMLTEKVTRLFLPTSYQKIIFHRKPPVAGWCHMFLRTEANEKVKTIKVDFRGIDDQGEIFLEVQGLTMVEALKESFMKVLGKTDQIEDTLHEIKWKEQKLEGISQFADTWLILADKGGVGAKLAASLKEKGAKTHLLPYDQTLTEAEAMAAALKKVTASGEKISHAIHMWSLDCAAEFAEREKNGTVDAAFITNGQKAVYASALALTQAVGKTTACPVTFVTSAAEMADPKQAKVCPFTSVLTGLARVVDLEFPDLKCRTVDLDWQPGATEAAAFLLNEVASSSAEPHVAYRAGKRLVAKVAKYAKPPAAKLKPVTIHEDATYMLTGGLGGIGRNFAKILIERGASNLVLVGRSELSPEQKTFIRELEASGAKVHYLRYDVAQEAGCKELFAKLKAMPRLRGVLHLAGVLSDASILQQNWSRYEQVMAPKVMAGWNLHEQTKGMELDFFVLFSSLTSMLGNKGQANYAAANSFMDSLAYYRQAQGLPGLAVNWGPWADAGMAAKEATRVRQLSDAGIDLIPMKLGCQVLEYIWNTSGQVGVWKRSAQPPAFNALFLSEVMGSGGAQKASAVGNIDNELIGKLMEVLPDERRDVLIKFLRDEVAKFLHVDDPTQIETQKGFLDIGFDSLMVVDFRNRLKKTLGPEMGGLLPATLMFDYPNLEVLTDWLLKDVIKLGDTVEKKTKAKKKTGNVKNEPIAIIGAACRYPGDSNSLDEYWDLLRNGRLGMVEIPKDRIPLDKFFDADQDKEGRIYTKEGGFIKDVDKFDAEFFGILPAEATDLDPQHRLMMEVAWEALENANIVPTSLMGSRTGVYVGVGIGDYARVHNWNRGTTMSAYYGIGTLLCGASGRVSYFLGLQGPSVSLDTACSSALSATHLACTGLRNEECEMAIVGGVNLILEPTIYVSFSRAHMLSPDGRCFTFDQKANGYARAEGCGSIVLKRLSDAMEDGDNILAVIRGTAINQDGRSSTITAPSGPSQEAVIREALGVAGVQPSEVGLFDAHGTGTSLGDPIEVTALGKVLREGRPKDEPLMLTSHKANIGHLEAGAGLAGVLKVVASLQNKMIPPQVNFNQLNSAISIDEIPAVIPTKLTPWEPKDGKKRIASVSAFGFTGSNAHAVIEEAPVRAKKGGDGEPKPRPYSVLCLSTRTDATLKAHVERYGNFLASQPDTKLSDVCFTAGNCRSHFNQRLAIVAKSRDEMIAKLKAIGAGQQEKGVQAGKLKTSKAPKVAFLFTGQGSQYEGMGKELYENEPVFKKSFDQCAEILKKYWDEPITAIVFAKAGDKINKTRYTQPCLFALEYSLAQLWLSWGVRPNAVAGHSVGEYVAACVAGAFSLEDGLKLITERARMMDELKGNGEMAAVMAPADAVAAVVKPYEKHVSIAAVNSPEDTVISGEQEYLAKVLNELEAKKIRAKRLAVSHAFHSPQMDPMLAEFEKTVAGIKFTAPQMALISTVTGNRVNLADISDAKYWVNQVRNPVRFMDAVRKMQELEIKAFLEIGPKPVLLGLAKSSLTGNADDFAFVASLVKDKSDCEQITEAIGGLYVSGIEINWDGYMNAYTATEKVRLPAYPFARKRFWIEANSTKVVRDIGHWSGSAHAVNMDAPPQPMVEAHDGGGADESRPAPDLVARLAACAETERRQVLLDHLQMLIKKAFGFEEAVDPETALTALGIDSLSVVAFTEEVNKACQNKVKLPKSIVFELPTLNQLTDHVLNLLAPNFGGSSHSQVVKPIHAAAAKWVQVFQKRPDAEYRIFCFPYAGGAANLYKDWDKAIPANAEVCAIEYPGRWSRFNEPHIQDMKTMVNGLTEGIKPYLDRPFVFFGYSLGAFIAFETACKLEQEMGMKPVQLFAAAARAPHRMIDRLRIAWGGTDEEFLKRFTEVFGMPSGENWVDNKAVREIFLPALRADVSVLSTYRYEKGKKVSFPITALGGMDDPSVAVSELEHWRELTTSGFDKQSFKGTHFFIQSLSEDELRRLFAATLTKARKLA
jgi:malonyl CoA-acyl carrier protein transacylase